MATIPVEQGGAGYSSIQLMPIVKFAYEKRLGFCNTWLSMSVIFIFYFFLRFKNFLFIF